MVMRCGRKFSIFAKLFEVDKPEKTWKKYSFFPDELQGKPKGLNINTAYALWLYYYLNLKFLCKIIIINNHAFGLILIILLIIFINAR